MEECVASTAGGRGLGKDLSSGCFLSLPSQWMWSICYIGFCGLGVFPELTCPFLVSHFDQVVGLS